MKQKRVAYILQEIWPQLKRIKQTSIMSLQLFRQEIQHFITILQGYTMTQVLDSACKEFDDNLKENVKTLNDIRNLHDEFLDSCIKRFVN